MVATSQNIATSHDRAFEALNPIARLLARQAAEETHQGNGAPPIQANCNEGQISLSLCEQAN